ncbi:uncharacterized protein LOC135813352 [Sycon ciliatum]|uniref:uncharacterized protein LOC135813352 n=1 Tax=Sycon ciliatum TaxID=27933 RepID=UPI0031F6D9BF
MASQRDWDVQLPGILLAYRTTPQSSTGYTPAYLLFGREVCLPQGVAYGLPCDDSAPTEAAYVRTLRQRLQHAHTVVRKRLANVHRHQARLHDAGISAVRYEVDDLVWLLVPAVPVGTTPKLARPWKGPFRVVDKLSEVVYRIADTRPPGKRQVVHANRLKRCHVRPERLVVIPEVLAEPPPLDPPVSTYAATLPTGSISRTSTTAWSRSQTLCLLFLRLHVCNF